MEKQKVFWVVLSVSVFVVVVLIVGVLLLQQRPSSPPSATVSPVNGTGTQVYEYQREAPLTPPGGGPQAGTPPAGDQQTMHFYIGEGGAQAPGFAAPPAGGAPSAVAPSTGGTASSAPAGSSLAPSLQPPGAPGSRNLSSTRTKPGSARPAVAVRAPRKTADYWIQTGSYKSQTKAEDLVALLESKGLGGRVFSYAANGDTFFRVRVGPYPNKGEADKFLALVKQVQGLESSYISMIPAAKSALN
ncbi:MAG: SPOR domain-containing protein [Spirochaetia bacterium]